MPPSRLWRAARAYAERHIHVFPLAPRSKKPLIAGGAGYLDATVNPRTIDEWWQRAPEANVGISCAASALVVIDVDTYKAGDETLGEFELVHGPRPRTWESLARGVHIYFRVGDEATFRGHLTTASGGVEIKHRGYVVAPPSVHPTGIEYTWDVGGHPTEIPLADLPLAWERGLRRRGAKQSRPPTGAARDTFFGAAFAAAGMLGDDLPSGAACARCPWLDLHTDKRGDGSDSSTVILPPTKELRVGRYYCSHAHCTGRSLRNLVAVLPKKAIGAAADMFPREMRALIWCLVHERDGNRE